MSELPKDFGKIPEQRLPFGDRLSALCAMELSAAHGDADRIGEMIERLLNSAGFTIAIAARGNPDGMSTMLMGAESYLNEAAARHAKMGAFMAAAHRPRDGA